MKNLLAALLLLSINSAFSQTLCGMANENGTVTITAPPGNFITSVQFASYGTPDGSCGSFTIGACHAANSLAICEAAYIGNNSASVAASNGVFGDPCNGTVKRLYVQVTYSTTLPLRLVGFTGFINNAGKVELGWSTEEEVNFSHFIIERSEDGQNYTSIGTVDASGTDAGDYQYFTLPAQTETSFYRLKMVDIDGTIRFSNVLRISNHGNASKLSIFPNPANSVITVVSPAIQQAGIYGIDGRELKRISLKDGSNTVLISALPTGVYYLRAGEETLKFVKQ